MTPKSGISMDHSPISKSALRNYNRLQRKRYHRLVGIAIEILVYTLLIGFVFFSSYFNYTAVRIQIGNDNPNYAYYLFAVLIMACILKIFILYLDKIPVLNRIQEKMEKREFERLKRTYNYQILLK